MLRQSLNEANERILTARGIIDRVTTEATESHRRVMTELKEYSCLSKNYAKSTEKSAKAANDLTLKKAKLTADVAT